MSTVVASLRAQLDNNDEVLTLHKDAAPHLLHLLDVLKHLAMITCAEREEWRQCAVPTRHELARTDAVYFLEWDHARFAELC